MPFLGFKTPEEEAKERSGYGALFAMVAPGLTGKFYRNAVDMKGLVSGPIPAELEVTKSERSLHHPDWDLLEALDKLPNKVHDPAQFSEVISPKIDRVRDAVGAPKNVTVHTHAAPLNGSLGTFVMDMSPEDKFNPWVHIPPKRMALDILAHEFGHATRYSPNSFGALRRAVPVSALAALGHSAGLLGGLAVDPDSNSQAAGLLAAQALLSTPQLAEEGYASIRAIRGLRKLQASGELSEAAIKAAKGRLLRAFGTYGAAAAGGLLGTAGLLAARRGVADDALGV